MVSLGQRAALASTQLLCQLQHERVRGTTTINTMTEGVHKVGNACCLITPACAIVAFAVVLGIAKCLPYELPSISNKPYDRDPYTRRLKLPRQNVLASENRLDLYGASSQGNATRVPLMLYFGMPNRKRDLRMRNLSHASYLVTGGVLKHVPTPVIWDYALQPIMFKTRDHRHNAIDGAIHCPQGVLEIDTLSIIH